MPGPTPEQIALRAAKLADCAKMWRSYERRKGYQHSPGMVEKAMRSDLAVLAAELGFAPLEISSAVDQALTDAGTTP